MTNFMIISGRLCADPEYKPLPSGIPLCRIRMAVPRNVRNKEGKRDADFVTCTLWRGTADYVNKYGRKGARLTVRGEIRMEKWTGRDGKVHTALGLMGDNVDLYDFPGSDATKSSPSVSEAAPEAFYHSQNDIPPNAQEPLFDSDTEWIDQAADQGVDPSQLPF